MKSSSCSGVRVSSVRFGVGVHGFQVEIFGFDLLPGDRPAPLTIARAGSSGKKSSKSPLSTGSFCRPSIRQVVVPDLLRRLALGEEEQVRFHAGAGAVKTPPGRLTMHQRSQSSSSLRLVWTKAVSFVRNSTPSSSTMPQRPPGLSAVDDMLEKQHLCCAGLVGKVRLRFLAFLAAKWRIRQHHVIQAWRVLATARRSFRLPVSVLPCQMFGSSMPCSTRLASAIG